MKPKPLAEVNKHISFCPHCGNCAPQRVVYEHRYQDTWYGSDGKETPRDEVPASEAILCVCETCNSPLLYDGVEAYESGHWPALVYPKGQSLPSAVPETIQLIYAEAAVVKRNAPNAFAMVIRKGLEAICDDRGAAQGTLAKRLNELASKGEIPPVLAAVSDVLRIVGNSAAHASLQKVTQPMTWAIDDFFCAVVEYVYVAPSKLDEFRKRLAKLNTKPET